jgi:hypothetical protein
LNVWQVIAGALLLVWPLQYRYAMGRGRARAVARGRDMERYDRQMTRPWVRWLLVLAPIAGVVEIVLGVAA